MNNVRNEEYAEVGYTVYRRHTGGKSLASGAMIPEWKDLRSDIKEAWEVAATAILTRASWKEGA